MDEEKKEEINKDEAKKVLLDNPQKNFEKMADMFKGLDLSQLGAGIGSVAEIQQKAAAFEKFVQESFKRVSNNQVVIFKQLKDMDRKLEAILQILEEAKARSHER